MQRVSLRGGSARSALCGRATHELGDTLTVQRAHSAVAAGHLSTGTGASGVGAGVHGQPDSTMLKLSVALMEVGEMSAESSFQPKRFAPL
jgi:hypothetical protein